MSLCNLDDEINVSISIRQKSLDETTAENSPRLHRSGSFMSATLREKALSLDKALCSPMGSIDSSSLESPQAVPSTPTSTKVSALVASLSVRNTPTNGRKSINRSSGIEDDILNSKSIISTSKLREKFENTSQSSFKRMESRSTDRDTDSSRQTPLNRSRSMTSPYYSNNIVNSDEGKFHEYIYIDHVWMYGSVQPSRQGFPHSD